MTPPPPFVGAVTMRPPAAFSSLTAIANKLTQSITSEGDESGFSINSLYNAGARRRTFNPPGRMGSVEAIPRCVHSCITPQISNNPSQISDSVRQVCSFIHINSRQVIPVLSQCKKSSFHVLKGNGI